MNVEFSPGTVVFEDLDLDPGRPLEEQLLTLKEDLLQVRFGDRYLLDVGWYPSFSREGCFRVVVVKDCEWTTPFVERTANSISELEQVVRECVNIVQDELV